MDYSFFSLINLDLLAVGITIAGIGVLGFVIFFSDRKSITNQSFLVFSLMTISYGIANYINYKLPTPELVLWALRFVIFFATLHAYSLLQLIYTFPHKSKEFSKSYKYILFPIVLLTALLTLTPIVFSGIQQTSIDQVAIVNKGPGILLFVLVVLFLVIRSVQLLIKKFRNAKDVERSQLRAMLIGIIITFTFLLTFNFILPLGFKIVEFVPLAPLFFLPFIIFTSYTILRHRLFNIKVAGAALLIFALAIVILIDIIFATNIELILLRSSMFLLVLVFGINLLRSVIKEVEQREKIEKQEKELEIANQDQTQLIHILNHQIKGYLSKGRIIFAELLEEPEYGPINYPAKTMIQEGFKDLTEGVEFVQGVLNSSSVETGKMQYNMQTINLKTLVTDAIEKQRDVAVKKGLTYDVLLGDGEYVIEGDPIQLKEAFKNLIDNSIHYTLKGGIHISLSRKDSKILFAVIDTGVGLAEEDKPRLFTKGGRGKDSMKINVNSTGYGLSFVKGVVEAHGGRVWAESQGSGKGSQFYVELPAKT